MTILYATVLEVQNCSLLVCDRQTNQQVLVNARNACCFSVGEAITIYYNGVMTKSIPPQITASCIQRTCF